MDSRIYASPPLGNCHATQHPRLGSREYPQSINLPITGELGPCTSQLDLNRLHITLPELRAYGMPIVMPQQPAASVLNYTSRTEIPEALDPTYYISSPPLPYNDKLTGVDSWPLRDSRHSRIGGSASTHMSIQDLYDLVRVVNHEWLQRLDSTPHLVSRCSKLASPDLFFRGIRAMQQCFSGSLTGQFGDMLSDTVIDSFENIFSLVHVACACAYVLHKDEDFYDWNGLFDHMFQWQYLLSKQDDVQCFLMAMDQLTCEHKYRLTTSLGGGGIIDRECYERTIDISRNGPVMTDCSRFLDGKSF